MKFIYLYFNTQRTNIPEAKDVDLLLFSFSDLPVSELDLIKFGIRCFFELGVVEKFKVPAEVRLEFTVISTIIYWGGQTTVYCISLKSAKAVM